MKSLTGVYLKSDLKEEETNGTILYPFMLIFPDKKRLYFLKSPEEKTMWVDAIKQAIGHANILTYYEVGEVLGKGKYGTVRQGRHLLTDRECAVKLVKKKELDLKELELLRREIEVLKVCQHPNIIRFYDVFENEHYIYIVMELLKGGDLFRYLQKQSFAIPEARAQEIAHQIATAIYYMHSFGIAHRDLKPENILLASKDHDSEIKLVDFGLSRTFGPGETTKEAYGTLCYAAPEILLTQPYEKTVDCWALGVITFLMLGQHLPFDSKDERTVAKKTILSPVKFLHPVWKDVSQPAKDLVLSLLVKKP